MSHAPTVLAPTGSLPRLRNANPDDVTQDTIACALRNLTDIYCPLSHAASLRKPSLPARAAKYPSLPVNAVSGASTPVPIDSGYASGDEEDEDCTAIAEHDLATAIRADEYERQFATRWLTTFLARNDELLPDMDDPVRQRLIDEAAYILASFSSATDAEDEDDGGAIVRAFRFPVAEQAEGCDIEVCLTDGTPATGADHTDVGLQSWGASIVASALLCAAPARFALSARALGTAPRIVELGAGTGLVAITLAKLLPRLAVPAARIVATDYNPAVLANLRANIAANLPRPAAGRPPAVQACLLDWAAPCCAPPLHEPAHMLIATDVVYAPEHAVWLRDCAAMMLAPAGVFWLIASVRPNGRFEGVTDTVEVAFADVDACPRGKHGRAVLRILQKELVEKRRGVGRGDEIGYKVFKIGWSVVESDSSSPEPA